MNRILLSWFFTAALAGHSVVFSYNSLRECERTRTGVQQIMQPDTKLSTCQQSKETGWLLKGGGAIGIAAGIGAAATLATQNGIASPSE